MADIAITASGVLSTIHGVRDIVFVNATTGYLFYNDASSDFVYKKTTDGGATWGSPVAISGADTMSDFDVWFDQWTPGDKGSCIHIFWFGSSTTDNATYNRLNTTNDTLSGNVQVFNGATAVGGRGTFVSGAKMRGGNLFCTFDLDAFVETGTYKSTDNGVTWSALTNLVEATIDQGFVFPGNEADPNDVWIVYQDASTDELTLKVYDDSAGTYSESASFQTMVEQTTNATGQYGFAGSIRHSDGHLIVASVSEYDPAGATADLQVFDINGTGSITTLTNIATNVDDIYYPSVFINQKNDDIYVSYIGKSDGTETMGTTVNIYYAKSTDRGITWTKDTQYSEDAATTNRRTWTPLMGQLFIVNWVNHTSGAIMTNYAKSIPMPNPILNNYSFVDGSSGISVTEKIR